MEMAAEARGSFVLRDLIAPDLDLLFCGTAPGLTSARRRAYYAHPQNRFWRSVHASGLTPEQLAPEDYGRLLDLRIGLTDLAKHHAGNDADLPRGAFDPARLEALVLEVKPRLLAFTSKTAARGFLGRRSAALAYGLQERRIGDTQLYVLPSPSPAAQTSWSLEPWLALGAAVEMLRNERSAIIGK